MFIQSKTQEINYSVLCKQVWKKSQYIQLTFSDFIFCWVMIQTETCAVMNGFKNGNSSNSSPGNFPLILWISLIHWKINIFINPLIRLVEI